MREIPERRKNSREEIGQRRLSLEQVQPDLSGFEDPVTRQLLTAGYHLRRSKLSSLKPLLPLMLALKGKPYHLADYFPFEPFFRTRMAQSTTIKSARQISKTTSLGAQGIILSASIPYFSTLFVTPLYEQVRRFSHNYVRRFIDDSPVRRLLVGAQTSGNVLQRELLNGSSMYFSYAFLDPERTRGIPSDKVAIDEAQDLNFDFVPIIMETLSGSPWGLKQYTGTPKSLENTMERLWQDSSQAEFLIKCRQGGCNYWNVPALSHDLLDMIGPWHSDISEKSPGLVCAKCRKPINPRRDGRWVHGQRELRWTSAGYHIPQTIMPMHYASQEKWATLLAKQQGSGNTTQSTFLNEVCGESSDVGSKLVTETDLKAAAILPWPNKAEVAVQQLKKYIYKVLAIDWGGGGGRLSNSSRGAGEQPRLRTSFTVYSVLGMLPDGKIDCLWGHRSIRTHDWEYEARLALEIMAKFQLSHLVHDYGGAGHGRLVLINQSGFPANNIVNVAYHPTGRKNIMLPHEPTDDHPIHWYSVDKARSLVITCSCIKHGLLRFFEYDYKDANDAGLLRDFLSLIEEKVDNRSATDIYTIVRNPNLSDDFAQAVNIGCCTLWYLSRKWPDLGLAAKMVMPPEVLRYLHPQNPVDWVDM